MLGKRLSLERYPVGTEDTCNGFKHTRSIWMGSKLYVVRCPSSSRLRTTEERHAGGKVIIFPNYLLFLDGLEEGVRTKSMPSPPRFEGSMDDLGRTEALRFSTSDRGFRETLVPSSSGGAALDLAAASQLVLAGRWWCIPR
jgi:hypothetical protein